VLVTQTVEHKELIFPFDFCLSYRNEKIEITSNSSLDELVVRKPSHVKPKIDNGTFMSKHILSTLQ